MYMLTSTFRRAVGRSENPGRESSSVVCIIFPLIENRLRFAKIWGATMAPPAPTGLIQYIKIKVCVNKKHHACSTHVRCICGVAKFFCNLEFYSIIFNYSLDHVPRTNFFTYVISVVHALHLPIYTVQEALTLR